MARKPSSKVNYKYHHIGIPTDTKKRGMIGIPHLRICASDHESNPFGIQWMMYEKTCALPKLVRTVPHVAFEVKNLKAALHGKKILVEPNSPSPGVVVAMIEVSGAPVELLEFTNRRANRALIAREFKKSSGSPR
jgi:hypothetical protein